MGSQLGLYDDRMDPVCKELYLEQRKCYENWIKTHFERFNLAMDQKCETMLNDFKLCVADNLVKVSKPSSSNFDELSEFEKLQIKHGLLKNPQGLGSAGEASNPQESLLEADHVEETCHLGGASPGLKHYELGQRLNDNLTEES